MCASIIQDGSQLTGSTMTYIVKILTTNLRHSTLSDSQEVYLGNSNNDRRSELATETGNVYISEAVKGAVKIPTTNLGYKTMYLCKIVLATIVQQRPTTENIDMAPKPEIITSLEL